MDPVAKIAQATMEENFNNYIRKLDQQDDDASRNLTAGYTSTSYQNGSKELTRLRLGYRTAAPAKKTGRVKVKSPVIRNGTMRSKQSSARQPDEARVSLAKQRYRALSPTANLYYTARSPLGLRSQSGSRHNAAVSPPPRCGSVKVFKPHVFAKKTQQFIERR